MRLPYLKMEEPQNEEKEMNVQKTNYENEKALILIRVTRLKLPNCFVAAVEGYDLGQKCAILALNSTINAIRYNQNN